MILQETLVERLGIEGTPVRSASEPDLDTDTDDPTKVLIRQIIGAVAQHEKTVIRGRMMAGKAAKESCGGLRGWNVPYGFRLVDGLVITGDDEQKVVALVGRRFLARAPLRQIADKLDRKGYRPRSGGTWHPNTIRRIAGYTISTK
jgi:DNA invertase Pin-like site-specific DNA recombinase